MFFNLKNNKSINKWYNKKLGEILDLCNHIEQISILNNNIEINKPLIEAFKNQQINDLNEKVNLRIEKYNNGNDAVKKRNNALNFIIKNKQFLENMGKNDVIVQKYCDEQYKLINETFSNNKNSELLSNKNNDTVDFID